MACGATCGTASLPRAPTGPCEARRGLRMAVGRAVDPGSALGPQPSPPPCPPRSLSRCNAQGSWARLAEPRVHRAPGRVPARWLDPQPCGPRGWCPVSALAHRWWPPALSHPASAPPPRRLRGPSLGGPLPPPVTGRPSTALCPDALPSYGVRRLRASRAPPVVILFIPTVPCSRSQPGAMRHRGLANRHRT